MPYDAPPVAIVQPADEESSRIRLPTFLPKGARCPPHGAGEIVVCAEDPEKFRLRPAPPQSTAPPPRTRMDLNERASIGAELESAGVGGQVSNRVMVRGRMKF